MAASISPGNDGMMSRLASNHEQRQALQIACYNTLLFVLLGICLCGLLALYNMLYMFLSSMLWAVLIGTVIFPLKRNITDLFKNWLSGLQESNTTLVMGLVKLPFNGFYDLSELFYDTMFSQTGIIITAAYFLLKILSYERTFMYIISYVGRMYSAIDHFILFLGKTWIFPLMVLYAAAYFAWIYVQEPKSIKKVARVLSCPIWIYGLSWISLYFGPLRAAVFGGSATVLILISLKVVGVEDPPSENVSVKGNQGGKVEEKSIEEPREASVSVTGRPDLQRSESIFVDSIDSGLTGDRLIRIISGLCALLWIVRHDTALLILAVPLAFAVIRKTANQLGLTATVSNGIESLWTKESPALQGMVDITVAGPLRQFFKVLFTSDQMLVTSLHAKMDVLSSVVVMLLLALGTLFGVIFVGFQIHGETVHLVRLTSNVLSSRPDWFAAVMNYTEDQLEENNIDIDNYVGQAYQHSRMWLAAKARSLTDGKDSKRADQLEEQVKNMVDKIYAMWDERNTNPPEATDSAVARGDWMTQLQGVTDLNALKEELKLIIQENVDTLMSVAKSVWAILAVNISFLSSILAAFAGVLLGFGMDILNFLIEIIVFLTMVYYLLSASTSRWLPMYWASRLTSVFGNEKPAGSSEITAAVEHAIFDVFVLSVKMSVFYGLYTYFVHSLFDLNIVFLPCLLASLFAAVPIMAPYIVCVFGVFELWLVRGESAAALVFALMSFAPVMFADATFYREVKGSHPYVTGLAIIGGMYWLGLQGVIIGPTILCSVLVLVNVYLQFVQPSDKVNKID